MSPFAKGLVLVAAVAVPTIAVLALSKKSTGTAPPAQPTGPTPLWAKFTNPPQVPAAVIAAAPPTPATELVGWYKYREFWIRVAIFPDSIIEDEVVEGIVTKMRVKAKYEWRVFNEGDVLLGTATYEAEGRSWTIFDNPLLDDRTDELIAEAKTEATTKVVNEAAGWLIASGIAPVVGG